MLGRPAFALVLRRAITHSQEGIPPSQAEKRPMRRMSLTVRCVTGVLVTATLIDAQQPAPPAGTPPAIDIDMVLGGWEKAMTSIQSLYVEDLKRTTLDKTFGTKEGFAGKAMYLKSNAPGQNSRAS